MHCIRFYVGLAAIGDRHSAEAIRETVEQISFAIRGVTVVHRARGGWLDSSDKLHNEPSAVFEIITNYDAVVINSIGSLLVDRFHQQEVLVTYHSVDSYSISGKGR